MDNSNEQNEVVYLYLDDIIPNRFQPRERFEEGALRELAASIKEHGVIQPIIVRKIGDKYEIIAGERRYKASALAGLTKIPAIIRNLDDKETSKVALLENLQRKNLSAIEEARTYQKILDLDQMTQFELAKTMGKSQPVVANKLRLLTLPDEVQEALLKEQISERHARSLLNLPSASDQVDMLHKIINNRMTVRETDEEVKKITRTENFGLPGLESVNVSPIEQSEQNLNEITKPNEIKLQNTDTNSSSISVSATQDYKINQDIVTMPDLNTIREQAVDINNINPIIEESSSNDISTIDNDKPFINLEELLNKTTTVPIEEVKNDSKDIIEDKLQESETNSKEPTEELLEELEPINENLEVESLEQDNTLKSVESTEQEKINVSEEKPLPSVIDTDSINVFDLRLAISDIRDKINELQNKGIRINAEEIDFENQYQIIIKIEK